MSPETHRTSFTTTRVTAIPGDGIGPEVMRATQKIVAAAGAHIEWEEVEAGANAFRRGVESGCPKDTIDSIARNRIALKGPLETPVGYGERSANVTLRKYFELYANVRPVRELPGISTPFSGRGIDFVVVRENVEDLYAGIEYMQTPSVAQCLKIISEQGCERIGRFAAELAVAEGRKKVTVATKANIMKLTEGMMKRVGERVLADYPSLQHEHMIVDNCAHQMVVRPEQFDVVVMTNMNGDILSDLAAGLVGGLGVAPSANLGDQAAIFEAVHGSAPQIAGRGLANPTALLLSATMMLRHIGDFVAAARIEAALHATLSGGMNLTSDIAPPGRGGGTDAFVDTIISHMAGSAPPSPHREYKPIRMPDAPTLRARTTVSVVGADVFIQSSAPPNTLAGRIAASVIGSPWQLQMLSNRGADVWPEGSAHTYLVDHYRARFLWRGQSEANPDAISDLLIRVGRLCRWMHVECLQRFGDTDGFSKSRASG